MHITKADIEELKARVDLPELVRSAGVVLKPQGKLLVGLCPFLVEKTPSFTVNPEVMLYNCFGACSAKGDGRTGVLAKSGGDCLTFVMKWKGLSFPQAYGFLGGRPATGQTGAGRVREPAVPIRWVASSAGSPASLELGRAPRTRLLVAAVDRWQKELSENRLAQEALEARGLQTRDIWRVHKLGYSSGSLEDLCGTEASEARRHLLEMGLLFENGNGSVRETMRGRIVVPFVAFNQLPVGVYGRSVKDDLLPHHRLQRGPRGGVMNGNAARGHDELIFVESPYDAFSFSEMGLANAVPLCGAALLPDHTELVRRFSIRSVVVGLDSDETGRKAGPVVATELSELGVAARLVEWPEKDPNALLMRYGPKKGREIVEALLRAPRACDLPPASPGEPSGADTDTAPGDAPLVPSPPATEEETSATSDASSASEPSAPPEPPPTVEGLSIRVPPLIDAAPSLDSAEASGDDGVVSVREEGSLESSQAPRDLPADEARAASPDTIPAAPAAVPSPAAPAPPPTPVLSREALVSETLSVRYDGRLWDVTWLESPSIAQLRARVHLELRPPGEPGGPPHEPPDAPSGLPPDGPPLLTFLDYLNLVTARARDAFCKRALALLPPDSPLPREALFVSIQGDLLRLAEIGEARRKLAGEKEPRPGALSPERRARGLSYLKSPALLDRVAFDIGRAGYVGEPTVKALGYLVSISRKLPEALSMVILSSSGSGKSALAEVLETLTPEEDLLVVTRFTASSLYWMGKDALKRKFVSIEERGGSQEADYSIRALQSKRKVTMMAPIKDQSTGKIETRLFEVEGPASFLESTTESQIHHENATRCFEVRLDESCEQTRRIQEAQRHAKTREGQREKLLAAEVATVHQDVQRLLRPIRVVIPYAAAIEFPSESIRTRRDNPRFLNLIEALAFLHQYQRPVTLFATGEPSGRLLEELSDAELDDYRIEATLGDYTAAYGLAADLLYETLAELNRPLRAFFSIVQQMGQEEAGKRGIPASEVALLVRQIRERTKLEQHVVRRHLNELVELEYLGVAKGVRGAAYAYRLIDLPLKEGGRIRGLLLPEELARKLERLKKEAEARKDEAGKAKA